MTIFVKKSARCILFYYLKIIFLAFWGGGYESPFTPDKWAKEKNTASLARGMNTNKRGPDRFRSRTCVQTAWSVEPLRVTRSVSNSTPGKYLSLADITFFQFSSFSVLKRLGVGTKKKKKRKRKEQPLLHRIAPPLRVCQSSSNPKFVCQSSSNPNFVCQSSSDLDAYVRD